MNPVKKVAMVIIMQNDLPMAVEFYKKLGLTLVFHVKDQWAEFKANNLQIGLCPTPEKVELNRTGIVFEVSDLEIFYEAQKDSLNFLNKPTSAAHGIMASIQDPSGNIVDLYQPNPEKLKDFATHLNPEKSCSDCACDQKEFPSRDVCCKQTENTQSCC